MSAILLQPGDSSLLNSFPPESTPAVWQDKAIDLARCTELAAVDFGMLQPAVLIGATTTLPVLRAISCSKLLDHMSPRLYDACLRSRPLGKGAEQPTLIHIGQSDAGSGTIVTLMTLALRDAKIADFEFQTEPSGRPTEVFKLSYSEILWTYAAHNAAGAPTGRVSAGWSTLRNGPIASFTS